MSKYLNGFNRRLRKEWKGSLVKVSDINNMEPNAKEYLNNLAKEGLIERVIWGWYWVPDELKDFYDFLKKERHFAVLSSQSAASFWNYDFIHRDTFSIKVVNRSFGKALKVFCENRGWIVEIEYIKNFSDAQYIKRGGLYVETFEEAIINCIQKWAFTDAFAVLFVNRTRVRINELNKGAYWIRLAGTDIRVRQVLDYGVMRLNELLEEPIFKTRMITIEDNFVRNNVDEAIERVVEFA
jgi:hypothetical protein